MVYSKTKEGNKVADQFKRHTIKRKYFVLVAGQVSDEQGKIEGFIEKSPLLKGGQKVKTATPEAGRFASTEFRVLERYPHATLLEVKINTGRTHQIRLHLGSIGHPVVGDKIYGKKGAINCAPTFPRQALHACYLKFHHPLTGEPLEFVSELPKDMRKLVDRLRLSV